MAWFGSGNQNLERYFPVPPAMTFPALTSAVESSFRLKDSDDFTMTVTFSKGPSAFTWGENFTAQVVPAEGGSSVRISGVGKVGGASQQGARIAKLVDQLFTDLTARLRDQQAQNQ